jgi:Alpha-tubulin suppressor and related RCC1 domain-containing proteins
LIGITINNGNGNGVDSSIPQVIVAVDAGRKFSVALDNTGKVHAWGDNSSHQVHSADTNDRYTPTTVANVDNIIHIAAGGNHTLALTNDGTIWAWGDNTQAQLGSGDTDSHDTPQQVRAASGSSALSNIVAIAAGYHHSLALSSDGKVWAWGSGMDGRLGNNSNSDTYNLPVRVLKQDMTHLDQIIAIEAGYSHSLALKSDGTLWAWGHGVSGELGDDMVDSSALAVRVKIQITLDLSIISLPLQLQVNINLALQSDGSVVCWGKMPMARLATTARQIEVFLFRYPI